MMRLLRNALVACALLSSGASAQLLEQMAGCQPVSCAAAAVYQGPGDVVASASAFYGLRAYNAAIVTTGTQKLANLRRNADTHTCDVIVSASGGIGNTANCSTGGDNGQTVASWLAQATFSGSMAGTTTLATTGDSCTVVAGDQITGAGIALPLTVTTVTSCAATVGSYVVSRSLTISAETMTPYKATFGVTVYNQNGSAGDVTQATAGSQPAFFLNCIGSLPCFYNGAAAHSWSAGSFTPASGVVTIITTGLTTSGISPTKFIQENGTAGATNRLGLSSANGWRLTGGTVNNITNTANDNLWHSAVGVINVASSALNTDGTDNTGSATGNTAAGTPTVFTPGSSAPIYLVESGFWDATAFTLGNRTSMCQNIQSYYGSSNFGAVC